MSCSVVIPTLGSVSLNNTIKHINSGSVVPDEILICIPETESHRIKDIKDPNVKILETGFRGQVKQRIHGFKHATSRFVMQLDDDMLVEKNCIQYLLETIQDRGPGIAVAPSLINTNTGKSVYCQPDRNKYIKHIYYWLMNGADGYQPGKIDKSGSSVGLVPENNKDRLIEVDWLAGGCVMHMRTNLVLENYWEPEGKAYYEDVVHSCELKRKGIRLFVDSSARCFLVPFYSSSFKPAEFFSNLFSDYNARKYFMNRYSTMNIRVYLFYIASCISYIHKKIMSSF